MTSGGSCETKEAENASTFGLDDRLSSDKVYSSGELCNWESSFLVVRYENFMQDVDMWAPRQTIFESCFFRPTFVNDIEFKFKLLTLFWWQTKIFGI